jgi:hypothetical protein
MNIFVLDNDIKTCASYHCNKHVVSQTKESAQILSTVLRLRGIDDCNLYRLTHKNHPAVIWTNKSSLHFSYLLQLFECLLHEYTLRYSKFHKCGEKLDLFKSHINTLPELPWEEPPKCMPDDCKVESTIDSYRKYYMTHKRHIASWKTVTPSWYF